VTARRYALETYRNGRRIDRDGVPLLVVLDLNDRDAYLLNLARDLLDRYLMRAAKADGARIDQYHEFEFAAFAADEDGRITGRELFRWTLPEPTDEGEISRWVR
jgi:hypothetical protein